MSNVEIDAGDPARGRIGAADLVCFSHLRWDFVYQRPQHLISRAARIFASVCFVEEPVFGDTPRPRLDEKVTAGTTVVVPVLPTG